MNAAMQLFVFLGLPFVAWWACRRSRLLGLLSPVMVVYAGGILFENLSRLGAEAEVFAQTVAGVSVMLSIALLMISADFQHWLRLAPITLLASSLAIATVVVLAGLLAPVFASHIDDAWKVAGMLAAHYTGSTVNMTAIATALDVDPATYGVVLSSNVVIGGAYLGFLFVAGGRVFGWFLPPFQAAAEGVESLDALPRPTVRALRRACCSPASCLALRLA